jgi:acetyltransferase-like isoleucine patch superfamily enzyme
VAVVLPPLGAAVQLPYQRTRARRQETGEPANQATNACQSKGFFVKYPLRDLVPYGMSILIRRVRAAADTTIARMRAAWFGVRLGRKVRCFGIPIIQRHPTATISIGSQCTFCSAEWANSIGINRRCIIAAGRKAEILIGDDCGFSGTAIAASDSIRIGNRVLCGANCTIVDTDRHPIAADARANHEPAGTEPIVIEDDVFLGMNVVVLKGCRIGKGTVVAANSVVTRSLPAHVVAAGMPAKVLKEL